MVYRARQPRNYANSIIDQHGKHSYVAYDFLMLKIYTSLREEVYLLREAYNTYRLFQILLPILLDKLLHNLPDGQVFEDSAEFSAMTFRVLVSIGAQRHGRISA